jgi:hypothetical protein
VPYHPDPNIAEAIRWMVEDVAKRAGSRAYTASWEVVDEDGDRRLVDRDLHGQVHVDGVQVYPPSERCGPPGPSPSSEFIRSFESTSETIVGAMDEAVDLPDARTGGGEVAETFCLLRSDQATYDAWRDILGIAHLETAAPTLRLNEDGAFLDVSIFLSRDQLVAIASLAAPVYGGTDG